MMVRMKHSESIIVSLKEEAKKIKADHDSIMKQALKVYVELTNEKKKLSTK